MLRVFIQQFKSPLIYLLFGAAAISAILSRITDSILIVSVLVFNALLGAIQEYRANKAADALKVYLKPKAKVIRDGKEHQVDADQLMVGDLVILEAGDRVPADCRLVEAHTIKLDESALTGESLPVERKEKDDVFAGTLIVVGRGKAKVYAIGDETKIGKLAKYVTEAKEVTSPLKKKIGYLAKQLVVTILSLSALIFAIGIAVGFKSEIMFATTVALLVTSIPEGLPVALTVILAIGMHQMAKRNAIIRRLDAVESLGSVTIICVDKTGTLTTSEITAQKIISDGQTIEVAGVGYKVDGKLSLGGKVIDQKLTPRLEKLLLAASLTNDARLKPVDGEYEVVGDPTEGALLILAKKAGLNLEMLSQTHPRVAEFPFDPNLKYMATLHSNKDGKHGPGQLALVKGAPASVYDICEKKEDREKVLDMARQMAKEGLRVLAFASLQVPGKWHGVNHEVLKGKMDFLGFVGFSDPIRPETAETVGKIDAAGIRLMMVTGDHRLTAQSIAKQAGMVGDSKEVIDGDQLDQMSDEVLAQKVNTTVIFSRISPEQKTRIVKALQKNGEVVAMTGDGVNDGPALVSADIGVGMGKIGTDVAKQAADIVITDDNLATIYAAIEEGRAIFANLRRVILYLLSGSFAGIALVGGSIIAGFGLPLTVGQILWINVVTDSFPDIALAFEPKESQIMSGRNRVSGKNLFNLQGQLMVLTIALSSGFITLIIFAIAQTVAGKEFAGTLAFALFSTNTLLYVFALKSIDRPIWNSNIFSNKLLNLSVVVGFVLVLLAIYFKPLSQILGNKPLFFEHWIVIITASLMVVLIIESLKQIVIRHQKNGEI